MDINIIYNLFRLLLEDKMSFLFHGNFSDELTDKALFINDSNIVTQEGFVNMRKRLSFLIAESFQNIVRHGAEHEKEDSSLKGSSMFLLRSKGNVYSISSANVIQNDQINSMQSKLEQVNHLNKQQLDEVYMSKLNNNSFSDRGGAGLGLIEMARKSGQRLDYDFRVINEEHSYFYLQIKLHGTTKTPGPYSDKYFTVYTAEEFHSAVIRNNISIVYKGDFSQSSVLPILGIIEKNLNAEITTSKKKKVLYHLLTEMLQNVSMHAYCEKNVRNGVFILGKNKDDFYVGTGNYISNDKVDSLVQKIEQYNSLSKSELNKLHVKELINCNIDNNGSTGLGMIEIARLSSGKIGYEITLVDVDHSFISLIAKC